jgi:hypothetical protein
MLIYKSRTEFIITSRSTATSIAEKNTIIALTNPPPTFTATPSFTSTPLPTLTSTRIPTSTPIPCRSKSTSAGVIYLMPSKGKTFGSQKIPNVDVPLYFHLENENWWLTSAQSDDGHTISGWINSDNLVNPDDCLDLKTVKLDQILAFSDKNVLLDETFSSFEHNWLTTAGKLSELTNGYNPKLFIRSGKEEQVFSRLDDLILTRPFTLISSFDRNNFNNSSYVGIKFTSVTNSSQFVELRISNSNCSAIWVTDKQKYNPISLGTYAACGNDGVEDYIRINYLLEGDRLKIDGEYNDAKIPPLFINGDFAKVKLELLVSQAQAEFSYVVITKIP